MPDRSPLPGMDPWLELFWSSVHHRLIGQLCDRLASGLPPGLFADVEVSVYVLDRSGPGEDDPSGRDRLVSDVAVVRSPGRAGGAAPEGGGGAVATPFRIRRSPEPFKQGHVVIRSFNHHEPLVTAIEILSPTNKADRRARESYADKRDDYIEAGANVVEFDLVRAGRHLIDVPLAEVPAELITTYKAAVRRANPTDDTDVEYYPLPLRDPLPQIAIPLRRTDPDAVLDVQAVIDAVYAGGRYGRRIDYAVPPDPPLSPDDAAWAADRIAAAAAGR